MLVFKKRFSGSYFATLPNGLEVQVQSYGQYTSEHDQDCEGNKWVLTFDEDDSGDWTTRTKTKKQAIEYANQYAPMVHG